MTVYCGNRHCQTEYSRVPVQCPECGCVEFVSDISLATGGYDEETEKRLMKYWIESGQRERARQQSATYGGGHVYHSQEQIDRNRY